MAPLILLLLLFAIAWVVLILPKQRELKRHNALVASLEVGDEVMTGSGFYGTIIDIIDDTVVLQLAPGTEVRLARRAVAAKIVAPTGDVDPTDDEGAADRDATSDDEVETTADPDTNTTPADQAQPDEDVDR